MYVELHAASAFSFLEAASLPEDLARTAARMDMPAMALVDRDGVYAAPRFHIECQSAGIRPHTVIGMDDGTVRYNPAKDEFVNWASGNNMFGLDPEGNVWHTDDGGPLYEINTASGEIIEHTIPTNDGVYDMDTDQEGRTLINIWRNAKLGVFDPETETYFEYPTPTSASGPRRGEIDAEGRLWVALYYAGRVARFDPDTGEIAEFPLVSGTEDYDPPYTAPYSTSVDNENGFVWTTDFNARRLYRIDMNTGDSTEYFLPGLYEMRDLTVEAGTERPTLWIPSYRPPSQIVKVQIR